jgi:hypothetical protein
MPLVFSKPKSGILGGVFVENKYDAQKLVTAIKDVLKDLKDPEITEESTLVDPKNSCKT